MANSTRFDEDVNVYLARHTTRKPREKRQQKRVEKILVRRGWRFNIYTVFIDAKEPSKMRIKCGSTTFPDIFCLVPRFGVMSAAMQLIQRAREKDDG